MTHYEILEHLCRIKYHRDEHTAKFKVIARDTYTVPRAVGTAVAAQFSKEHSHKPKSKRKV